MFNSLQKRVAKLEGTGEGGCDGVATTLVYGVADGRVLVASCAGCGRQHPERVRATLAGRGAGRRFGSRTTAGTKSRPPRAGRVVCLLTTRRAVFSAAR
jgi:hypothetical protein